MRRLLDTIIPLTEAKAEFRVCKPPERVKDVIGKTVFLAGSIDQGRAVDWQKAMEKGLSDLPVTILNPRRDDWDSSWEQDIENDQFTQQVTWELDGQEIADIIAMYFDPEGKAPITLLELGLFARENKIVVCCPEGYWRRGNVQIACARFGIPMVETLDDLIAAVRERLT